MTSGRVGIQADGRVFTSVTRDTFGRRIRIRSQQQRGGARGGVGSRRVLSDALIFVFLVSAFPYTQAALVVTCMAVAAGRHEGMSSASETSLHCACLAPGLQYIVSPTPRPLGTPGQARLRGADQPLGQDSDVGVGATV